MIQAAFTLLIRWCIPMLKHTMLCALTLLLSNCTTLASKHATHTTKATSASKPAEHHAQNLAQSSSRFLYLAGESAAVNGQHALAIQLLSTLVNRLNTSKNKADLSTIPPRLKLATLLLQNNQANQALAYIKPLMQQHPISKKNTLEEKKLHTLYAQILVALKQHHNALDVLTALLAQHPDFIPARKLQIGLFIQTKQLNLASIAIKTAIQREDSAFLRQLQADVYAREGQFSKAMQSLKLMQKINPEDETPTLLQSQLFLQQKNMAQAQQVLRDFIQSHPSNLRARHALARLLIQTNHGKEAVQIYTDMAKDLPESTEILSTLGLLYYQQQQFKRAAKQFRHALNIEPDNANYRFYLGNALEAQNQNDQARKLYLSIENHHPLWKEAQLRLASMDLIADDYTSAYKTLQPILKKYPRSSRAWTLLSTVYLAQEKFQLLLDKTQPAITLKQIPARLLLNRAIAFEHFKRYNEVEHTLKALLSDTPKDADALNFLGYTYAEQGIKLNEAEKYIQRALTEKPDDGYFLDSLAWVHFKRGAYPKAIEIQKKALEKISDDATMQEHLGDMFWKNKQPKQAIAQWEKALSLKPANKKVLLEKIKHGL